MLVWLFAVTPACSSRAGRDRAEPPAQAAIDACTHSIDALVTALHEMASESGHMKSLVDQPWITDLACAGLYREPTCAKAWQATFTAFEDPDDLTRRASAIFTTCRAAYCPRLAPKPASCGAPRDGRRDAALDDSDPLIDQLIGLDTAILSLEGVDQTTARAIAARADILRVVTASRASLP